MRNIIFIILLTIVSVIGIAAYTPDSGGYSNRLINGYVAVGTAGDDVWIGDGAYPFQSASVTTYASSSSANDTSAGTGCRTLLVEGLDSNYSYQSETVSLNGTTNVALTNTYLRINKVTCQTVGSGGLNAGSINVGAAATALAVMQASAGVSESAVYTIPAAKSGSAIASWSFGVEDSGTSHAQIALEIRPYGGSWQRIATTAGGDPQGMNQIIFNNAIALAPKTDLRVRVISVSGSPKINSEIEILEKK